MSASDQLLKIWTVGLPAGIWIYRNHREPAGKSLNLGRLQESFQHVFEIVSDENNRNKKNTTEQGPEKNVHSDSDSENIPKIIQ